MADTSRDSYDKTKSYSKVTFQRGRDVPDFELNELQDIVRNHAADESQDAQTQGVVTVDGLKVVGTGAANDATVTAGTLYYNGLRYNLAANTTLTALGMTPNTSAADEYDTVYLRLREIEVTSATDTTIAVGELGETAVRRQLEVTWTYLDNSVTVPANSATTITAGGTHYVRIARIHRANGIAAIDAADVLDERPIHRAISNKLDLNAKLMLTAGASVGWTASSGALTIRDESATTDLDEGLQIVWPGSGFTASTAGVIVSGSWTLTDGQCLYIEPARWQDQTYNAPGGTGDQLADNDGVAVGAFADIVGNSDDYLVLAYRIGNRVLLHGGRMLENTELLTEYAGDWGPRQGTNLEFIVGIEGTTNGDAYGGDGLKLLIEAIKTASTNLDVTIRLTGGIFTVSALGAAADRIINGTGIASLAFKHIKILGAGRDVTFLEFSDTNLNAAGAYIDFTASGTNRLHLTMQDMTIRRNGAVGANAVSALLLKNGETLRLERMYFQNCNVEVDNTPDVYMRNVKIDAGDVLSTRALQIDATGTSGVGTVDIQYCHLVASDSINANNAARIQPWDLVFKHNILQLNDTGGGTAQGDLLLVQDGTAQTGKTIIITDNILDYENLSTSGETLHSIHVTTGRALHCDRNQIRSGGAGSSWIGPAIRVNLAAITPARDTVTVNDNSIHANGPDWGALDNIGVYVDVAGTVYRLEVDGNVVEYSSVQGTPTGVPSIVKVNSATNYGSAIRNVLRGASAVSESARMLYVVGGSYWQVHHNRCIDLNLGNDTSTTAEGIRVEADWYTITGNIVRIKATPSGTPTSNAAIVMNGNSGVATSNFCEADYPVDFTGSTDCYFFGNTTKDCTAANVAAAQGAGTNSTFASADNKTT